MTVAEIIQTGFAAAIGSTALAAVIAWLAKVFARHLLEADRNRYARDLESLRQQGEKEIERLRNEGAKRIHVHSVQFEAEFRAYQEIWKELAQAILATLRLRPMLDGADPNLSTDQEKARKLVAFGEQVTAFKDAVRRNYPFVPHSVTAEIETLMTTLSDEGFDAEAGRQEGEKYGAQFRRARDSAQKIHEQSERIRSAIQKRIGLLEIVD